MKKPEQAEYALCQTRAHRLPGAASEHLYPTLSWPRETPSTDEKPHQSKNVLEEWKCQNMGPGEEMAQLKPSQRMREC